MAKLCRRMAGMRIFVLALLFFSCAAQASDELWELLRKGGQVVMIRHALTEAGVGDPQGFRLSDCTTQRNLSEEGRAHAKRIGEAFRLHRVPVDEVLASPWCRCVETASLAFDKADLLPALANLFGRSENRERQVEELTRLVGTPRRRQPRPRHPRLHHPRAHAHPGEHGRDHGDHAPGRRTLRPGRALLGSLGKGGQEKGVRAIFE